MRILYRLIVLITLYSFPAVHSQSLPTGHWSYESIRKIQILGGLQNLTQGSRPYARIDIAGELVKLEQNQSAQLIKRHPEYAHLILEFENEIIQLQGLSSEANRESIYTDIGFVSRSTLGDQPQLALQARINYTIHSHLSFQYGVIADQAVNSGPNYLGYTWRGIAGYQDQMFLLFERPHIQTMLGRDYVVWGYSHGGGLFITDNSRPFDMMKLTVDGKMIRFESFVAQLDPLYDAERYLTATRLAITPRPYLTLGFGQSALYGGINRALDFTLSNPLAFYSFSQDNDQKHMNMMLYADIAININQTYRIYGELLIDDFQIDREKQSDLEPNEIAFVVGGEGISLFNNLDFWIEYTQVRNRTYNVPEIRPWEKFIHRGKPIAHAYGTDFQLLAANSEIWINSDLQSYVALSVLRRGEGTVLGVFTEPWMADGISLEGGYSESIPSGIIESVHRAAGGILWRPKQNVYLDLSIAYEKINNVNNIATLNSSAMIASLELSIEYDRLFKSQ